MAKGASKIFFLLILTLLTICSSGLLGLSYHGRGRTADSSTGRIMSFLKLKLSEKELGGEEEQMFLSSRRELLHRFKVTLRNTLNPPTVFPTDPTSTTPVTLPPGNPTPTIVTVPATNPVTVTPAIPESTPVPFPSTTPITVPSAIPNNPTVPITNPVTTPAPITVPGAPQVTNPVTTYPSPAGVPVTTPVTPVTPITPVTPVTNPVPPPAVSNAPPVAGQSWCVAKTGVSETTLQTALDYACGTGGADCSQIQQGASCYNPNTLQNHASYAFNSYYQKNPSPLSCEFGGTATLVNTNPSSGTCIYPSSASSTASPSTSTSTPTTAPTTPSSSSSSGTGGSSSGVPPAVMNSGSNPASPTATDFGSDVPPSFNTSTSMSIGLKPFIECFVLVTSIVAGVLVLYM